MPGDIVLVEAGDRVPADGRLLQAATLEMDESALTGESVPVPKQVDAVAGAETPLGDRVDMVYMNTNVTRGTAEFVVTATGMSTEVGHISGMLPATEARKDAAHQAARHADQADHHHRDGRAGDFDRHRLSARATAWTVAVPDGRRLRHRGHSDRLAGGRHLPAGDGTTTLAAAHAIVKRLRSVETLGATSAINSDKTGTLTLNQMTAVEMAMVGQRLTISGEGYSTTGQITRVGGLPDVDLEPYLLPMALAADAVARDGGLVGDPTEGALVVLAAKGGIDAVTDAQRVPAHRRSAVRRRVQAHGDVPRDDRRRRVAASSAASSRARRTSCWTRACERADGRRQTGAGRPVARPVPAVQRASWVQGPARHGAGATRLRSGRLQSERADFLPLIDELTLLALVGIVDPARPEAKVAIAEAHAAGMQVRMITGDHAVTAAAIASQLGIPGRAITRRRVGGAMSDDEADKEIDDIGVIARVTPEHKVRLVEVLKRKGHVVSMTGDGVNDAPALKKADIGVAMGITGTDVSKEAAVMILTDDNFATIVKAVELGRELYDSLVKYIRFQMARLFGFILMFLGAALFNIVGGIPFLPFQTLYMNFTVDMFLAIGLGLGAATPGLMQRPPRRG